MVIGVTDESPALVDAWVAKNKPSYPVVILKSGKFESFLGVQFFPTGAVIAPDGKLLYSGSAGMVSGPLGDAMSKAEKGSAFPKCLAKASKYMRENQLAESYAEVLELLEGTLDDADRPFVERFKTYLKAQASDALSDGKALVEAGYVYEALNRVEDFAEAEPAFPATPDCRALVTSLRELPEFKDEMKGGEKLLEARQHEDAGEYEDAVKVYKAVYKKYDGTRIAANAREAARDLVDRGMPGYRASCQDCRQGRRACDKHHEDVKL